jgi:hypothetical protein
MVTPAGFNLWLRNADNLNFSIVQSCSPHLQFNSNFYRIRSIRFLSKISFRLIISSPHEPDENAQISNRSILDLDRITTRRTIAKQQEENEIEIKLKTEASLITKIIQNLPRIVEEGCEWLQEPRLQGEKAGRGRSARAGRQNNETTTKTAK